MPKTLHEQINDVVVFYLEEKLRTNTPVDVAAMAREITQSLVDMIMEQDEQNQAPLLTAQCGGDKFQYKEHPDGGRAYKSHPEAYLEGDGHPIDGAEDHQLIGGNGGVVVKIAP